MSLKRTRQQAGLSQEQLADLAAIDHSTIAKLEIEPTRYLGARYDTVIRIARALRKKPHVLFPVPKTPAPTAGA
jgi:transcriptional regulator with XRE-family HTH domain